MVCAVSSLLAEAALAQSTIGGPVAQKLQGLQGDEIGVPKKRPDTQQPVQAQQEEPANKGQIRASEPKKAKPISDATPPTACLAQLQTVATAKRTTTPISKDSQCVIDDPVELIATKGPYSVAFAEGLTLDCTFALALAEFTANTLQPLARHHLETTVTKLGSGQGFVCRRRNNATIGRLSEHAFGNAFDLTSYVVQNKPTITVRLEEKMKPNEAAFQRALRKAACGTFTTVLGPGSNKAHATHLHFDLGRSEKKNPYRICE